MAAAMQMGSDTENLIGGEELESYSQIVLSPLNRTPDQLRADVEQFRSAGAQVVLDTQLYYPKTPRQTLKAHPYFPKDLYTADVSDLKWWTMVNKKIAKYGAELCADIIVSPAVHPKVWTDDYFAVSMQVADDLHAQLAGRAESLACLLVGVKNLADSAAAPRIASIASSTQANGFYVVFVSDVEPRRELHDDAEILGMLTLLHDLGRTEKKVMVAFAGPEMILEKLAGANSVGTGKFFNLRRHTQGRYEEPTKGGGQAGYLFVESLLAFLRTADILRLQGKGYGHLLTEGYSGGIWAQRILEQIATDESKATLRLSWRQYLSWFGRMERRLCGAGAPELVKSLLKNAEDNWKLLEDADILMDDRRNDGQWIRPWRQALCAFNLASRSKALGEAPPGVSRPGALPSSLDVHAPRAFARNSWTNASRSSLNMRMTLPPGTGRIAFNCPRRISNSTVGLLQTSSSATCCTVNKPREDSGRGMTSCSSRDRFALMFSPWPRCSGPSR